jgi:hypothetical protein
MSKARELMNRCMTGHDQGENVGLYQRPCWMTGLDPKLPFDPMPPQQVFRANCRTDECAPVQGRAQSVVFGFTPASVVGPLEDTSFSMV